MEPAFVAGDLVLINPKATPMPGDVVVARHPFKNIDIIKYVQSADPDGYLALESPAGDDSRHFGRVTRSAVKGTVTYNWKTKRER